MKKLNSPAEVIDTVLDRSYDDYLVSHYDGAELRKQDIRALANFAAQYNTVEAFLADVALTGEFAGETVVTGPIEQEFVILSTVHQATLSIDGHINLPISSGATITVKQSANTARFLRIRPETSFYSSLEQRLKGKQQVESSRKSQNQ